MTAQEQTRQTETVIGRHIQALTERNLDALLADYSEDACFLSNLAPTAIQGKDALRGFWAQALEVFTPEVLAAVEFKQQIVVGEVAYLVWSAGPAMPLGSDTFVVRDGKIVAQTGTVQILPPGR